MKCRYWLGMALIGVLICGCMGCNEPEPVKQEPGSKDSSNAASQSGLVECDWTMEVHDTVETNLNGAIIVYTLDIDAVKNGGTDDIGSYQGTLHLKQDHKLPPEAIGVNYKEFDEKSFSFELAPYKSDEYADYGLEKGVAPVAPLIQYDSMCLKDQNLNGRWHYDVVDAEDPAIRVSNDDATNATVKIKMVVEGGQVKIDIVFPFQKVPGFKGMITGSPVSG